MNGNKVAPLSGVLGIGGVLTGLWMDNFPGGHVTDADVAHWIAVNGTARWIVSGAAISLGGAFLMIFAAVVAMRVEALGAGPLAAKLTQVSGTAWSVLTMVGGALWISPAVSIEFFEVKPTANLLLLSGPAYAVLVSVCAFAAALLAASLATVGLRTGLLPRWLSIAGFPAAFLMLANTLLPMAVITLWFVPVVISLTRRGGRAEVAEVNRPVPAAA